MFRYFFTSKFRQLRSVSKGYKILDENNSLALLSKIKHEFSLTKLSFGHLDSSLFPSINTLPEYEITYKQFVFIKCVNLTFNRKILFSIGGKENYIIHPLPFEWRLVLERHGFKANTILNKFVWVIFVLKCYLKGVFSIFKYNYLNLKNNNFKLGSFVYFDGLVSLNIPTSQNYESVKNIITWYLNYFKSSLKIGAICHSVRNTESFFINSIRLSYIPSAILPLSKKDSILKYFCWSIHTILLSIVELLRCNFANHILLEEANHLKLIQLSDVHAEEYYFHNSNHIYRPLWTYALENKSKIVFIFYSTNCETFKRVDGYSIQENCWDLVTWNNYLVWDDYQKDFLERNVKFKNKFFSVKIVGSIWFTDSTKELLDLPKTYLAVFDIQPMRLVRYHVLGLSFDYYNSNNCIMFVEQIFNIAVKNNMTIVFKKKRSIGPLADKKYENLINRLSKSKNFLIVDPDVSAHKVIKNASVVISMPFTSTALIAKEYCKPSVFFDPIRFVQVDDRASHGIPILNNIDSLSNWLLSNYY
jgi:polysaccharide biosynthesis PFTS motif protein